MSLVRMAYKSIPAGHNEPPRRPKDDSSAKFSGGFFDAFQEFLEFADSHIELSGRDLGEYAIEQFDNLDISKMTNEQLNSAVLAFKTHKAFERSGYFMSGFYIKSNLRYFNFDLKEVRNIKGLGYKFPQNKTLVLKNNNAVLGEYFEGCIVNLADENEPKDKLILHSCGLKSGRGMLINYGNLSVDFDLCIYHLNTSGRFTPRFLLVNYGKLQCRSNLPLLINAGSMIEPPEYKWIDFEHPIWRGRFRDGFAVDPNPKGVMKLSRYFKELFQPASKNMRKYLENLKSKVDTQRVYNPATLDDFVKSMYSDEIIEDMWRFTSSPDFDKPY